MLKDIINKYGESDIVPTRLNVVDILTSESGCNSLNSIFKDMQNVSTELLELNVVSEHLNNESGLVSYLASQGFEQFNVESANDTTLAQDAGRIAKDIWETIKKAIKILIDKFILYFNKAKLIIMNLLDDNQGKINALRAILQTSPNDPVVKNFYGDDVKVAEKFPMFDNFIEPGYFIGLFEILNATIENLYILEDAKEINLDKINIKNEHGVVALLDIKSKSLSVIVKEDDTFKRKDIEIKNVNKFAQGPHVMKKSSLETLLNKCELFNKSLVNDIKNLSSRMNKLSEIKFTENTKEMEKQNRIVQLEISAIKEWMENVTKILKNTIYFIALQTSCYKINDKSSRLNDGENSHDYQKEKVLHYIKTKDWDKLELFLKMSGVFSDIRKLAEEALANRNKK